MAKAQKKKKRNIEISIESDLKPLHSVHTCCIEAIFVVGYCVIYSYGFERWTLYSGQHFK